jgi:hypothetical protein
LTYFPFIFSYSLSVHNSIVRIGVFFLQIIHQNAKILTIDINVFIIEKHEQNKTIWLEFEKSKLNIQSIISNISLWNQNYKIIEIQILYFINCSFIKRERIPTTKPEKAPDIPPHISFLKKAILRMGLWGSSKTKFNQIYI